MTTASCPSASRRQVSRCWRGSAGVPLDNDQQTLTADDVKKVLDGWASDLSQSYTTLRR